MFLGFGRPRVEGAKSPAVTWDGSLSSGDQTAARKRSRPALRPGPSRREALRTDSREERRRYERRAPAAAATALSRTYLRPQVHAVIHISVISSLTLFT